MFLNTEGKDIKAIAAGDNAALCRVYKKYMHDIYRYAFSLTKSHHVAEDILQDTIIRVKEKAYTYNGGNAKAWIITITHSLTISYFRKNNRELQAEFFPESSTTDELTFCEIISLLPDPVDREIIGLRINGGFKNKEVAKLLGMNSSAVSRRYKEALKVLRRELQE